jgi:hypothetical protein
MLESQIALFIFLFFTPFFTILKFRNLEQFQDVKFTFKLAMRVYLARILRIFPLYYFVFFFGWYIISFLPNTAQGYIYETLYTNCDGFWWANLLFINNWVPAHLAQTEGCFFWNLNLCNDLQLFLLTPFFYMIYKYSRTLSYYVAGLIILADFFVVYGVAAWKDFTVGGISLNNDELSQYMSAKPYMLVMMPCYGFLFVAYYIRTIEYRYALRESTDVKESFPIIHRIATKAWVRYLISFIGFVLFMFIISAPYKTNKNSYIWKPW